MAERKFQRIVAVGVALRLGIRILPGYALDQHPDFGPGDRLTGVGGRDPAQQAAMLDYSAARFCPAGRLRPKALTATNAADSFAASKPARAINRIAISFA
jgi:hypothetical protein